MSATPVIRSDITLVDIRLSSYKRVQRLRRGREAKQTHSICFALLIRKSLSNGLHGTLCNHRLRLQPPSNSSTRAKDGFECSLRAECIKACGGLRKTCCNSLSTMD